MIYFPRFYQINEFVSENNNNTEVCYQTKVGNEITISSSAEKNTIENLEAHESEAMQIDDQCIDLSLDTNVSDIVNLVQITDEIFEIKNGVVQQFRKDTNGGIHLWREFCIEENMEIMTEFQIGNISE